MKINIGDRVAFSRAFLRNTGQFTGWAPFARGQVTNVKPLRGSKYVVAITWDDGSTSKALSCNLVHENRIHLEPA